MDGCSLLQTKGLVTRGSDSCCPRLRDRWGPRSRVLSGRWRLLALGRQNSSKASSHPEPVREPSERAGEPFSEKAPLPSHEMGKAPNSTDAATHTTLSGA